MDELKYEITKELGVLGEGSKGWTKEINMVSWNDRPAKFDIRDWAPEHAKMAKGITLNMEEAKKLKEILNTIDFSKLETE